MKLRWTPEARTQLRQIEAYVATESPLAARQLVARLIRRGSQLAELPRSGRKVPEFGREDVRELLEAPYRIVYRIHEARAEIDILTVWHYRRRLPQTAIRTD